MKFIYLSTIKDCSNPSNALDVLPGESFFFSLKNMAGQMTKLQQCSLDQQDQRGDKSLSCTGPG